MGQVISAVLAENEHEHEEDTVEQLQILQKLAAAKLEAKAIKLATDAFEDKCLPIVAVVDKVERYAVKAESAPAPKVQQCIDDIFQGHFLEGLEHAVCTAMDELLGNTSAGEQERSETHVVFANNTLLRVDYYCYKYEFGSHGLRDKFRNAFSYVVQVGVLDNIRVDPQIALYELGKSIGRDQISEATENLAMLRATYLAMFSTLRCYLHAAMLRATYLAPFFTLRRYLHAAMLPAVVELKTRVVEIAMSNLSSYLFLFY